MAWGVVATSSLMLRSNLGNGGERSALSNKNKNKLVRERFYDLSSMRCIYFL